MDTDGVLCIGAAVGGTPTHFEVSIDGDVYGILTIPGDQATGDYIADTDEPLVVRYIFDNICYVGNLDVFNNRLTLTEV
jgi:hypothetical protein